MLETLALFTLALAAFFIAARVFKKMPARASTEESSPLDAWASGEMARLAATKLLLDERSVAKALAGEPDPDTVTALERGTRKVELLFERVPGALGGEAADVSVELSFEDGSSARAQRRAAWTELSSSVRDEFARSGSGRVYRARPLPWQR